RGGEPAGPGTPCQGVHAGVLGPTIKRLGAGVARPESPARHESSAQADPLHAGIRSAEPKSPQAGGLGYASGHGVGDPGPDRASDRGRGAGGTAPYQSDAQSQLAAGAGQSEPESGTA